MSRSNSDQCVKIEFQSMTENVAFARAVVAVFASRLEFTLDEIDEIKVAVSEAVSNAVVHGYRGTSGVVRLFLDVQEGALVVTVEDEGCGIKDVEWASQPAHTTEPDERMGLGLVFMNEYMNDVEVESMPGRGTRVRMVKSPLQAGRPPQVGPSRPAPVRH